MFVISLCPVWHWSSDLQKSWLCIHLLKTYCYFVTGNIVYFSYTWHCKALSQQNNRDHGMWRGMGVNTVASPLLCLICASLRIHRWTLNKTWSIFIVPSYFTPALITSYFVCIYLLQQTGLLESMWLFAYWCTFACSPAAVYYNCKILCYTLRMLSLLFPLCGPVCVCCSSS